MSPQKGLSFDRLAIGLLAVGLAFRALLMPAQNDTFWHLRAGADIWRTGHLPTVDSYSFTAVGLPWRNHEWLWQALEYACFRVGGLPLLTAVAAAFVLAAAALTYRLMVGPRLTRFVLMAVGMALASSGWSVRPQVVTVAAVAVLAWLLARERYRWIPPLFLVWANLHGGVLFGGAMLLAATAAAAWRWYRRRGPEDGRRLAWLACVGPLSAVAICATPLGLGLFRIVRESNSYAAATHVTEWDATLPTSGIGIVFWVWMASSVVFFARRPRALGAGGEMDSWTDWMLVAATLALLPMACRSQRHIAPFMALAIPTASRLAGARFLLWPRPRGAVNDRPGARSLLNLALFGGAAAVALGCVAFAWATANPALGWRPLTPDAIAAVRACPGPLYNQYDDGGFLIWFTPERPVFVDSRQPDPYPFMREAIAVEGGRAPLGPLLDRWGIRCALLERDAKLVGTFARAGWTLRFRDPDWIVFGAPPAARATR